MTDEGLDIRVTASYGIATLPEDARDREELLSMADKAMFCSKGRGKDRIMASSESLIQRSTRARRLLLWATTSICRPALMGMGRQRHARG